VAGPAASFGLEPARLNDVGSFSIHWNSLASRGKSGSVGRQGDDEEGTLRERDDGSVGRREERRRVIRDSLVVAANELFVEVGYDAAKTGDIAARANVAQATLFRHFETKADLALFHLRAEVCQLVKGVLARPTSRRTRWRSRSKAQKNRVTSSSAR
jgi:hypothetical protein